MKFPRQLIERGKAEKDSLFLYAIGHLVVWVPKESKLDVAQLGMKALSALKSPVDARQIEEHRHRVATILQHFHFRPQASAEME